MKYEIDSFLGCRVRAEVCFSGDNVNYIETPLDYILYAMAKEKLDSGELFILTPTNKPEWLEIENTFLITSVIINSAKRTLEIGFSPVKKSLS